MPFQPLFEDADVVPGILEHIPMGRLGSPQDLGGVVVYLASDASSYVTGQVLFVEGGYLSV